MSPNRLFKIVIKDLSKESQLLKNKIKKNLLTPKKSQNKKIFKKDLLIIKKTILKKNNKRNKI
jgi:hypothetical protein